MARLKEKSEMPSEEILIIEDSPTQAEYLRDILERHGYRVWAATNGQMALATIAALKPSLIISDIIMPEMDGYELCRRIKADERNRDIPVILLTSLADPRDVMKGLECGADNFITKPYDEEYLLARIRHIQMDRLQSTGKSSSGELALNFGGQDYSITADRRQILNLLLSTYETAIQKNRELIKARDEMRELNEQLEAANKELETFSYTVSHDLRGPLNNIHGSCQVIREFCGDMLDDECKTFLQHVFKEISHMDKLISTILKFSLLSRHELQRKSTDLSSIAKDIVADLQLREPQRRVTFHIAEGITAVGDPVLLRGVLENLLGNAWKYTGKQESAFIEFGIIEAEGKPTYYVRDNGAGFDMSQADKLFGAFQRLHSSSEYEGHGIGLATVHRIITRHNGHVWAEGATGKGATFYFTIE